MFARTLALGLIAASLTVTPAAAQEDETNSAIIKIDDLNLSSAKGQARLETRIRSTIRQICTFNARDLSALDLQKNCEPNAMASARPQADRAIAAARSNQAVKVALNITPQR